MIDLCPTKGGLVTEKCMTIDWPMIAKWLANAFRQPGRGPSGTCSTGGGKLCSAPKPRGSTCPHSAADAARTQHDQSLRVDAPSQASLSECWPECLEATGPWPKTSMHIARTCVLPAFFDALCTYALHDAPSRLPCPSADLNSMRAYTSASLTFVRTRVTNASCGKHARATPSAAPRRRS